MAKWYYQKSEHGKCGALWAIDNIGKELQRCVWANRLAIIEQLTANLNQEAINNMSSMMVQKMLLYMAFLSRCMVIAFMLTAIYQQWRIKFACQYRNWTSTKW